MNIAQKLKKEFWSDPEILPRLSIVDTIIYTLAYSSGEAELSEFKDLILPAQLFKVAKQKYNAGDWRGAVSLARRALHLDGNLHGARVILVKALVRLRDWANAEEELVKLENEFRRERFYLRGFQEWKRGHHRMALSWFKKGWDSGDQSISIVRDSAYCSFVLGDMEAAKYWVDIALKKARNKYTIDLAANIAIFSNHFKDAENYIEELKPLDLLFYLNRKATLLCKQNRLREAWVCQEQACATEYPNFDAIVQRIDLMILMKRKDVEEQISKFEKTFKDSTDLHRALWCKYYLSKGQWRIAEDYWKKIWQKDIPSFKDLRKMILSEKIGDIMISSKERKAAEIELSEAGVAFQLPLLDTELEKFEI